MARQLEKTYVSGDITVNAIQGVYFTIEPASFVSFIGPSGSGKSTLLNMIGCLDPPTKGTLQVAGREITNLNRREADLVKSFTGDLQTIALTTVALPVVDHINEDFGETYNVDLAAKLYLLYKDTDVDFLFLLRNSQTERFGFDFSKNLATNFEIHGELAYIPDQKQVTLQEDGSLLRNEEFT